MNTKTKASSGVSTRIKTKLDISSSASFDIRSHKSLGTHLLVEFYGCNQEILDDEIEIKSIVKVAAIESGATLLKCICNKFAPQGVTALALLAESHISVHTWPEYKGVALCDFFTCGDADPYKAVAYVEKELEAKSKNITVHERGKVDNSGF